MTETASRPGVTGRLLYAEDKSGLDRVIIVQAIAAPLTFAAIFVPFLLVNSPALALLILIPAFIAWFWMLASVLSFIFIWPVGIRIDEAGIRIGGVQAWERRQRSGRWPPRKPFHVGAQGRAVFTCPWEGVRELYLITGRKEIKPLARQKLAARKRAQQLRTPLGWLGFMYSGLVIVSNPACTSSDPPRFRPNRRWPGHVRGTVSPTWLVPTRHPEALKAALANSAAPVVQDRLPPDKTFFFSAWDVTPRLPRRGGGAGEVEPEP
jgi:hypothetical protein